MNKNVKSILNVTSGNFFEMYDFMVYGIYASIIGENFFPNFNPYISLMLSFTVFGAGFLMRPLGAIILGAYIDQHGRKKGLQLNLILMAIGMIVITCTPSFNSIGHFAPLLVLCGRLIQGFSAGVELGGVSVYLAEIAPYNKRGFFVSWQSASQQIAVIFAAGIGFILNLVLTTQQMFEYGWRIPFLIGILIVPIIFWQRSNLPETKVFLERKQQLKLSAIFTSVLTSIPLILICSTLVMFTTVSFYMITAYTPTYGKTILNFSQTEAFLITACIGLSNFILLPLMGILSDKIGRLKPLIIFTLLGLIVSYPLMHWLTLNISFINLLFVEIILAIIYSGYNGSMVVTLTELVRPESRTIGFALSYSIATAIYGGFTPLIATNLIYFTNDKAAPGIWLSIAAFCSFLAILLIRLCPASLVTQKIN